MIKSSKVFSFNSSILVALINLFSGNKKKNRGTNNVILCKNTLLRKCTFNISGNNNKIIFKPECNFKNVDFFISGNDNVIEIGKKCQFAGGGLWIEDNNNLIRIGQSSTFGNAHLQVTESNKSIVIGEDCMFAYDIELKTGDSHSILDLESNIRINFANNILVGDHVWVGAHVVILKGVIIGDNSIIGTNSLCTKSIAENCLAVGIPAKIIKTRINWTRDRKIV